MPEPSVPEELRLLVTPEERYEPGRLAPETEAALVGFALAVSDYWAGKALDWLAVGCPIAPVRADLRAVIDDRRRPQPLRHRALRLLRS